MLKLSDAGVKNRWIEREEKLCTSVKESDEIRALRVVVHKKNSRGPRAEP